MQYRSFGQSDWKPSALGFGAMRLPLTDPDDFSSIDTEKATEMLDCALDGGVNLIDTAYPYHRGASESFLGEYLTPARRKRTRLSTKLPSWLVKETADFDRYFDEQRERLKSDSFDIYLLHALNEKWWGRIRDLGVLDWVERKLSEGQIGILGFSFHDGPAVFRSILDEYDAWSCCLLQYNYMDVDKQAGAGGLGLAHSRGMAVMAMEPLRGGQLARRIPAGVASIFEGGKRRMSPVEWALQWIWNQPEVSLVLSGMSSLDQVRSNLEYAGRSGVGSLSDEDQDLIASVRELYRSRTVIPCTRCDYCKPCPADIPIAHIFDLFNSSVLYDDLERMRTMYGWISEERRADNCSDCGDCEEKCPQSIPVRDWLAKVHGKLQPD